MQGRSKPENAFSEVEYSAGLRPVGFYADESGHAKQKEDVEIQCDFVGKTVEQGYGIGYEGCHHRVGLMVAQTCFEKVSQEYCGHRFGRVR